jgi:hypothetical protein
MYVKCMSFMHIKSYNALSANAGTESGSSVFLDLDVLSRTEFTFLGRHYLITSTDADVRVKKDST